MPEVNLVFPTPIWTNKLGLSTISRLKIIDFLESVGWEKGEDMYGRSDGWNTTVIDLLSCPELTEVADLIHNNMESFVHEFLGVMDERHSLRRSDSWSTKQMMGDACHEHNHSNSIFSGVYYPSVPKDSGEYLHFVTLYPTWKTNEHEYDIAELGIHNKIWFDQKLEDDLIVIFPSWLMHSVGPSTSDLPRYCIPFNYVIDGEFGGTTNYLRVSGRL